MDIARLPAVIFQELRETAISLDTPGITDFRIGQHYVIEYPNDTIDIMIPTPLGIVKIYTLAESLLLQSTSAFEQYLQCNYPGEDFSVLQQISSQPDHYVLDLVLEAVSQLVDE